MIKIIVALLALLSSSQSYSLGRTVTYKEVKGHLFNTITKVSRCGNYLHHGVAGEVRLIEAYIYGGSMIR